ncbi:MAG: four helix bundle protein [Marinifilaceae bacterium]
MKNFKNLKVWQQGICLVSQVYELAKLLPSEEKYGLYSQITRAAVSIPSNVAEGCSRSSKKDFHRFVEIALGSSFELETLLFIMQELNYSDKRSLKEIMSHLEEEQKMLQGLMKSLKKDLVLSS